MAVAATASREDHDSAVVREGLCPFVAIAVEGFGHAFARTPIQFHCVVVRHVEVFFLGQSALGCGLAWHSPCEYQRAVVGCQRRHIFVGIAVDVGTQIHRAERHRIGHGLTSPFGGGFALARFFHPQFRGVRQADALVEACDGFVVLVQRQMLFAQHQVGFSIGGVYIYGLVQQADGLLVLPHDALLHRLLEQRFALLGLPQCHHGQQQKHQCQFLHGIITQRRRALLHSAQMLYCFISWWMFGP